MGVQYRFSWACLVAGSQTNGWRAWEIIRCHWPPPISTMTDTRTLSPRTSGNIPAIREAYPCCWAGEMGHLFRRLTFQLDTFQTLLPEEISMGTETKISQLRILAQTLVWEESRFCWAMATEGSQHL